MPYFIIFILFISIFTLLYGILTIIYKESIKLENRINQLKEIDINYEEQLERSSFFKRMIKPFYLSVSEALLKITPKSKLIILNKRLEKAGILKNNDPGKWIFYKSIISWGCSSVMGLLSFMIEQNIIKTCIVFILVLAFINYFFNFNLSRKIYERKKKILKELPYTLDLITVSVEAGLSFDGAISRVINNISGELCEEFAKSLKEIRMGIERKTALKNMSERCGVNELSMFITSIIQADELGVSLSKVLRIESANLREHRKQVSREKAMKAPIKMLFPLVFFIFPSIFIIILGPAVIRMINIFGKG